MVKDLHNFKKLPQDQQERIMEKSGFAEFERKIKLICDCERESGCKKCRNKIVRCERGHDTERKNIAWGVGTCNACYQAMYA